MGERDRDLSLVGRLFDARCEIERLRSDLAAALSRAEKAEEERDRMREALEEISRCSWWERANDVHSIEAKARAALSTGEPTPRVEPVTKRL